MRKTIALFICLLSLMCLSPCAAAEIAAEEQAYYIDQMETLVNDIGDRNVADIGQEEALEYLTEEFQRLGCRFEDGTLQLCHVDDGVYVTQDYASDDVIGVRKAQSDRPSIIILCAHYDSNGPGARDNASGVAGVLMFLRRFSQMPPYANTELRFIAFTAEETGHQGSGAYVESLSMEERDRIIAVFNMDIIVVDTWDLDTCLSCDIMGGRTAGGYVDGWYDKMVNNRASLAFIRAVADLQAFDPVENGETYAVPRYQGDSDHETFHKAGIDAASINFRGKADTDGSWTPLMHTKYDVMGDFDWPRTWQALDIIYTAVDGLARDASYGD
jgi:Zn-dependent M28 family amino/carboxypeptidase